MSRGQRSFARTVETATDAEEADDGAEVAGARWRLWVNGGGARGRCPSPEGVSKEPDGVLSRKPFGAVREHEPIKTARMTAMRTTITTRE